MSRMRIAAAALPLLAALLPARAVPAAEPYVHLIGALHEHSGYSDGWPGSTPRDYFASAGSFGLAFLGSGEHSDNADLPNVFSEYCLTGDMAKCVLADDEQPANSMRKWDATLEYARAASSQTFTGFRGFEWTSDVFGHINVYFSEHDTNAKSDGGYGSMATFWEWFLRSAGLGGGADGIATFNHPNDKCSLGRTHPTCDWNNFEYVAAADARMVGIELFNGTKDYGKHYVRALDKGWHVGAVGAEDKGHDKPDRWGGPEWAKTVIIDAGPCHVVPPGCPPTPPNAGEQTILRAMGARHMYAVLDNAIRIDMDADGELMGSTLVRATGQAFSITASVTPSAGRLEIVSNGGTVVAGADGSSIAYAGTGRDAERYYLLRVLDAAGKPVAYSSPVWVKP